MNEESLPCPENPFYSGLPDISTTLQSLDAQKQQNSQESPNPLLLTPKKDPP